MNWKTVFRVQLQRAEKELFSHLIIFLAVFGIVVNVASLVILMGKRRNTLFHNLLKILALYDLVVVIGCALLYSMANLWTFYRLYLYPRILPWILPVVQETEMSLGFVGPTWPLLRRASKHPERE